MSEISMEIKLNNKILDNLELSKYEPFLRGISRKYFRLPSGKESYRLLIYLSDLFNDSIIIDLGTSNGASALALSSNPKNNVISFDIKDRTNTIIEQGDNITPIYLDNIDFITTSNFLKYLGLILSSLLIYLDIAHDGVWEKMLYNLLIENNYKGVMIMDDIYEFPELKNMWEEIKVKKYDITKYGHYSGFGIVDFSGNLKLELE